MESKESSASFTLECENEAFSARRESIFGNLPVVELAHKELPSLPTNSTFDTTTEEEISRNDDVTIYKGEESMFKRPMPKLRKPSHPPRRNLNTNRMHTPDHKKNPHKWVKYSLSSTSEVTEKSNTAAAFSFLRELEDRKRKQEPEDEPTDSSGKIVFKKPKTTDQHSQKNKTYRDGKLCMPAFEFGSKKQKDKSKKQVAKTGMEGAGSSQKKMQRLSHLDEGEEEGDDNNDDNVKKNM